MGENALLMPEVRGDLVQADRKATVTQITTCYNHEVCRRTSLNTQYIKP